jgi:hypothetical protein
VVHLPSKLEALSVDPSTNKTKQKILMQLHFLPGTLPNSFFFLAVLGLDLRVSNLLGRHFTSRATHWPYFVLGIFKIGSQKLLARLA